MKTSIFVPLVALASHAAATRKPTLQYDPDTAADCVEWYNNSRGESCEDARNLFGITPEEFHKWNPSVGLDCQPWNIQSYCIVTLERLENANKLTTTTSTAIPPSTTTSSAPTLGPSPTSWTDLGCYDEDPETPILEEKMSPAEGDAFLTVSDCLDTCYRARYKYAGMQEGNQCWCSSYVGGEWTKNQADCNTPCSGDSTAFCGGKGLLFVYRAEENWAGTPLPTTSTSTNDGENTGTTVEAPGVVETTANSGAARRMAIFRF